MAGGASIEMIQIGNYAKTGDYRLFCHLAIAC